MSSQGERHPGAAYSGAGFFPHPGNRAGFFPQPGNRADFTEILHGITDDYYRWHAAAAGPQPPAMEVPPGRVGAVRDLIRELSGRLSRESTPWPSPLYLAHMTADTPIAASLAYLCALLYNPNNVTPEASPVTTELEHEVGDDLCRLVGHRAGEGWAHLSSGGHAANYEAIWIARNLRGLPVAAARHPGARDLVAGLPRTSLVNLPVARVLDLLDALAARGLLAEVVRLAATLRANRAVGGGKLLLARNAHYAWDKCADLLGFAPDDVEALEPDAHHRLDLVALERRVHALLERGRPIVAVVAALGSCGEGSVDDLRGIVRLREQCERRYGASFYLHVDAAFGGYFRTVCLDEDGELLPYEQVGTAPSPGRLKPEVYEAFRALPLADSVTVDPHKSGHVPYPAGGLVLRDRRAVAVVAGRTAYFGVGDGRRLPYGPHTLEGARPGAAAAAVWAAHRLIGLHSGGYGRLLADGLAGALRLHRRFTPEGPSDPGRRIVSCYEPDLNIVNLSAGPDGALLLERLRAAAATAPTTSLWVSGNTLPGAGEVLRLCVMKALSPTTLEQVCHTLRDAAAAAPVPL